MFIAIRNCDRQCVNYVITKYLKVAKPKKIIKLKINQEIEGYYLKAQLRYTGILGLPYVDAEYTFFCPIKITNTRFLGL